MAAVLTVLTIIVGPFFQQSVVFYHDRAVDDHRNCSASAAFTFNIISSNMELALPLESVFDIYMRFEASSSLVSAMWAGLFGSAQESLNYPPFLCPTGSCTWAPFPSLTLGHKCIDTTENFYLNCSNSIAEEGEYPDGCVIGDKNGLLMINDTSLQYGHFSLE
ncbi:hypothetical protein CC78DRAFT_613472 [Lojkania enalia]|uniref:Uncharacterized protein n=1 Tax=Lojkania enalia TaxID=147567 RepID=A0A9P4KJG8_9PLEO|nr:hypothetical protein CC78DRAFT_613472 [Didymosphaeria enalia]